MYVHSVRLVNYKSFGDYNENEIILEPNVTAIIGKNESGKSNVLDGLSQIRFRSNNSNAFKDDVINRNGVFGKENTYLVTLKPLESDVEFGFDEDTIIEIHKNSFSATGGILKYYQTELIPCATEIIGALGGPSSNPFQLRDQDWNNYRSYCNSLLDTNQINIPLVVNAISYLKNRIDRIAADKRENLRLSIEKFETKWMPLLNTIPLFFYRSPNKHLNSVYKIDDVDKELKSPNNFPNSMLNDLVKVLGISASEFILAAKSGTEPRQNTVRNRINRMVDSKVNAPFKDFYKTEEIKLEIGFNAGVVTFSVQSSEGESLSFSERSNGLRWYLETFIDAQANNLSGRNVVYLLDEPGVSLHVNAQRKLLELFSHLASQGNQVIYTTHSPYMLDTEQDGIHRIRAVVKDEEGYSRIYKTAYDQRIAPESQQDTLAPIISALGMNLNDTFGPAKDKINIVTEGMSDYIFVCTMAKVLEINKDKYCIIPSVGASNCINICTILHGWGCRYIALFDYDKAGVETGGEIMRKKLDFEYQKQYCYLSDVTQDQISAQTYKTDKYMIEDVVSRSEIERFYRESGQTIADKTLTAKLMCNAIEDGSFVLSETTIENFKNLFNRVLKYCS